MPVPRKRREPFLVAQERTKARRRNRFASYVVINALAVNVLSRAKPFFSVQRPGKTYETSLRRSKTCAGDLDKQRNASDNDQAMKNCSIL